MLTLAVLTLLPLCFALSQKPLTFAPSQNPLEKESFVNLTHTLLSRYHVSGISISIVDGDEVYARGFGLAALPDVPASPETLYYAASTTKSFTAAALNILMDDLANTSDAFSWTTPVSQLIREDFVLSDEYVTTHVTLEDLASHRSGLPEHIFGYGGSGSSVRSMVQELRGPPLSKPFRTTFQYCNRGWVVLSHVAEIVSGQFLGALIRERIWEPLGMMNTYFGIRETLRANVTVAQGYTWDEDSASQVPVPHPDLSEISGAGIMISSVLDYTHYLKMMLAQSKPLSPSAHKQLRTARMAAAEEETTPFTGPVTYGLGWFFTNYRNVTVHWHTGSLPGSGDLMAFVPSLGVGVMMMSNNQVYGKHIEFILFAALLDDLLGSPSLKGADLIATIDEEDKQAAEQTKHTREIIYPSLPAPLLPHALPLEAYQGTYVTAPGYQNLTFTITHQSLRVPGADPACRVLRAEALHRTWPHAIELEHVSGEYFIAWLLSVKQMPGGITGGARAEFRIDVQGEVAELGIKLEGSLDELIWYRPVKAGEI